MEGIWYCVPALVGVLCGHVIASFTALRVSGLGPVLLTSRGRGGAGARLLEGSLWLFLAGVGLPLGLQSGRLLLAHLSTPQELAAYALAAQMYGMAWSVLSTAGMAYWPVFVKRRGAHEATVRLWWSATGLFAVGALLGAIVLTVFGPLIASVLSGGQIEVGVLLTGGFGALLLVQGCHLPAGVLLTRPSEARWQAFCIAVMAVISVGAGLVLAGPFGAAGVVSAGVLGVLLGQCVPDLLCVPALVRRRPLEELVP